MKTYFTIAIAMFAFFSANAQYINHLDVKKQYPNDDKATEAYLQALEKQSDSTVTAVRTTWVANKPSSNWFLSLEGGLAWLGSENYQDVDLKDNLKPTGGFSLGKWFTPVWGIRLNASAAKLKSYAIPGSTWYIGQNHSNPAGFNSAQSYISYVTSYDYAKFFEERFFSDAEPYKEGFLCDFTYVGASVDFLLNLRNLTSTYDPQAFFNPIFYAGVGFTHTLKDGDRTAVNNVMGKFGLQFDFRLSDRWSIYLAGETMIVPEVFDRLVGGDRASDAVVNAKIGLTYQFGYNHFIKAPLIDQKQLDSLNNEINTLRNLVKKQ
jgi:hypothetical protein